MRARRRCLGAAVAGALALAGAVAVARGDDDEVDARALRRAVGDCLDAEDDAARAAALDAVRAAGGERAPIDELAEAVEKAILSGYRKAKTGLVDGGVAAGADPEREPALRWFGYVPPKYSPRKAWPLVLALHPAGDGAREYLRVWHVEAPEGTRLTKQSAQLYRQAEKHGWMVLAPEAPGADGRWEQSDEALLAALRALDAFRERYRVDPDRVVVDGFSSGAGGAWRMGVRFADRLAGAVPRAGGFDPGLMANLVNLPVYVIHGKSDESVPFAYSKDAVDALRALDPVTKPIFREMDGGHTFFPELAEEILDWADGLRRQSHPERIEWIGPGGGLPGSRAYWIDLVETVGLGHVKARVDRDANAIALETERVEKLRVRVSERLLDLSRPVAITWNGEPVFEGEVKRDLAALLDEVRATRDPARVFAASLELARPR